MPRNRIIINILYLFHLLDRYLNLISSTYKHRVCSHFPVNTSKQNCSLRRQRGKNCIIVALLYTLIYKINLVCHK